MQNLPPNKCKAKQKGIVLIVFVTVIALGLTAYIFRLYDAASYRIEQEKKTLKALALAKQALIAYSEQPITAPPLTPNPTASIPPVPTFTCGACSRPGEFPCPDTNNDGVAESGCGTLRLGRLPWRTLGIGDIRDGSGERLWYALSDSHNNNPKALPLNSNTLGRITLRNSSGAILYDGTTNTGLVAVVIAPNNPLTRSDNIVQNRISMNINLASHFLDILNTEDNANFVENSANGFVSGKALINGRVVVNDIVMPITRDEVNTMMEARVLSEVKKAIEYYYSVTSRLPHPAAMNDASCLGNAIISPTNCVQDATVSFGRIPVGSNTATDIWAAVDLNSILKGAIAGNWFQQNGWRELIFFAPAPACTNSASNCLGAGGLLTVNNAITPLNAPSNLNKQMVLMSGGKVLSGQTRTNNADKSLLSNYIEEIENLDLNTTYLRHQQDDLKNDRLLTTP